MDAVAIKIATFAFAWMTICFAFPGEGADLNMAKEQRIGLRVSDVQSYSGVTVESGGGSVVVDMAEDDFVRVELYMEGRSPFQHGETIQKTGLYDDCRNHAMVQYIGGDTYFKALKAVKDGQHHYLWCHNGAGRKPGFCFAPYAGIARLVGTSGGTNFNSPYCTNLDTAAWKFRHTGNENGKPRFYEATVPQWVGRPDNNLVDGTTTTTLEVVAHDPNVMGHNSNTVRYSAPVEITVHEDDVSDVKLERGGGSPAEPGRNASVRIEVQGYCSGIVMDNEKSWLEIKAKASGSAGNGQVVGFRNWSSTATTETTEAIPRCKPPHLVRPSGSRT